MSAIDRDKLIARLGALAAAAGRQAARSTDTRSAAAKMNLGIGLHLAIGEVRDAPEVVEVCAVPARRKRKSGT